MTDISQDTETLLNTVQSCMLSTLGEHGFPEASVTPYYRSGNTFYIYISNLASHTTNLRKDAHCSILICEDESSASNIFARTRLILKTQARFISPDEASYQPTLAEFETARGATMKVLRTLPDFHLIALDVLEGDFIQGFGKAFHFEKFDIDEARLVTGK